MTVDRQDSAGDVDGGSLPVDVLGHDGPWTEGAYLEVVAEAVSRGAGRVELVDGAMLLGPAPTEERSRVVDRVRDAIAATMPEGLRVVGPVALRLRPDCVLVPDLVVTRASSPAADAGKDPDARAGQGVPDALDAAEALMVVEVVGRENGAVDRLFKPQVYARGRIPYSVIVDHDSPFAAAAMIIGGRYHEYARVSEQDGVLALEEPFRMAIPLGAS